MTARVAYEAWQLVFPAIGLAIFATVFLGALGRVWRMKSPRITHLEKLPLENETSRPVNHGRSS